MTVRPKKNLGQHFLRDENIARKITGSLDLPEDIPLLEIGPGTGVLTKYLFISGRVVKTIEIDREAYAHLQVRFPSHTDRIILGDFLKYDLEDIFSGPYAVIGNFPYNISSQIFFRILDHHRKITQVVCMVQKEVAERLRSGPGTKTYGILSVLLQAFYEVTMLFPVSPSVFSPPPKVHSAVIRLARNNRAELPCPENTFRRIVKTAFNQRRKILRNSLKAGFNPEVFNPALLDYRPEQLGVEDFIQLAIQAGL
jgi:16S rRNA (adenine1518-N6/adenine1519-N6)-dimethyltransferase